MRASPTSLMISSCHPIALVSCWNRLAIEMLADPTIRNGGGAILAIRIVFITPESGPTLHFSLIFLRHSLLRSVSLPRNVTLNIGQSVRRSCCFSALCRSTIQSSLKPMRVPLSTRAHHASQCNLRELPHGALQQARTRQ